MIAITVHTTGVNWDGILANASFLVVIISAFSAVIIRSVKHSIRDEIRDVIALEVTPKLDLIQVELRNHDTRLARLEGMEEGKRQAIAQAGVSRT